MNINPLAVVFVALCTAIGALLGNWLIGLGIALAVLFVGTILEHR